MTQESGSPTVAASAKSAAAGPAGAAGPAPWFLLAAVCVFYFWQLGLRPLYAPDEGRYAQVGKEMLDSGDWVIPRLAGVPYLDKPPMLYWLEAAGMGIFGRNEWGAHFFVACTAVLGVWLMFLLGREMYDRDRGILAAAVFATSALYAALARVLITDLILCVFVLGAFLGFWRAWKGRSGAIGMWISLGLAFMTKGPVGPALFAMGAVPFWLIVTPRPPLRSFRPALGPLLFLAIALPWTIFLARRMPGYLEFFYWRENIKALGSTSIHHPHPWHYAFTSVITGFLPWTILLPFALWPLVSEIRRLKASADPAGLLALLWAGTIFVLFTVSVSKLATYFLPMFPALSLIVARAFGTPGEPRRAAAWTFFGLAIAIPCALLVAAIFGSRISARFPDLQVAGWVGIFALICCAGSIAAGFLFRSGRAVAAAQAVVATLALAVIPGVMEVRKFDNYRSTREILLRNADLLRSCDAILSDRSPVGLPEFYLGVKVTYLGTNHDFRMGREFEPGSGRFIEDDDVPDFLKTHPRTVLLTTQRKKEDVMRDFPMFREIDSDQGNLLLMHSEAIR